MNYGHFAGRIGRDAETKTTPNGKEVTEFSVAVNVGYGDRKSTLWVKASMWGERGTKVAQYLKKGTAVTIAGEIDVRQYKKKDGENGVDLTCNVQALTLQGSAKNEQAQAPPPAPAEPDFDDSLQF